jgi:hypothetical protein
LDGARKIRVKRGQYRIQFAAPHNVAGQMKNDLRLHGIKYLSNRRDVREIGEPPSKVRVCGATQLTRRRMYLRTGSQQSVAEIRTNEPAAASDQHPGPRNWICSPHHSSHVAVGHPK